MKLKVRRIVQAFLSICIAIVISFLAGNRLAITNYINQYTDIVLQSQKMVFYNWNSIDEDHYVSGEDPQIIMNSIETYVNNLQIDAKLTDQNTANKVMIYYTEEPGEEFSAEKCILADRSFLGKTKSIEIKKKVYSIRLDLTEEENATLQFNAIQVNPRKFGFSITDGLLLVVMLIGAATIFYYRIFLKNIYRERELIITLVRNDLKSRYAGSFFGLVWAFVQPCMTILVFWVVFELGFRTLPVNNVKFILWFVPAYIPWIYFSDAVVNTTSCLREYSYLVKKMKFPIEVLPVVKVLSSFIIHIFFVLIMSIIYAFYRYKISIMALQIIYYAFALTCLLLGISWLISAIAVFMKDFTQIISIVLQLGFFMIPIFWNDADMSSKVLFFLKFNPAFYIVQGYRESMIDGKFFWDRPILTAYYWIITIIMFALGIRIFKKLRGHFADLI